jgi:CRISPR-associated protein Cst2
MANNEPKNEEKFKNIFGSVLTNVAPASNYRGETQNNRAVLQKLTKPDGEQYSLVSAEAIRSRLREMLSDDSKVELNRSRVINPIKEKKAKKTGEDKDEEQTDQITVRFSDLPNRNKFADDLIFGFLMIDGDKKAELLERGGEKQGDSILRVNYAVSLDPFPRYNFHTMHQSPLASADSAYQNSAKSALIEREVQVTAFQYPFGLNLNDLRHIRGWEELKSTKKNGDKQWKTRTWEQLEGEEKKEKKRWVALLLRAIGELNGVAGNHARTMYPFAPVSIVMRVTHRRAPEFDIYGFKPKRHGSPDESHNELVEALKKGEFPDPAEFYIGGRIVKDNDWLRGEFEKLNNGSSQTADKSVHVYATAREAIEAVIAAAGLDSNDAANQKEQ